MPIILVLIASFCGASANILFKHASAVIMEVPFYKNAALFAGIFLFTMVLILLLAAFRLGGETFIVYPTYATSYIWIVLLSYKFENAEISKFQILGMFLVALGVSFIGANTTKS